MAFVLIIITIRLLRIVGDIESGKSTLLKSWANVLINRFNQDELIMYLFDSNRMGLYDLSKEADVKFIQYEDDLTDFIENIINTIEMRRIALNEARKYNNDIDELISSWQEIVFMIDDINEFIEKCDYSIRDLIERIINKEAGLKISIFAAGDCRQLSNNYDSLAKAFKDRQCGVLLGFIKDQDIFNIRLPYGSIEKEFEKEDGYFISKNKYTNMRFARIK